MSDSKSKLPDMNELSSMASKLFKDVKTSIEEIVHTYKKNRSGEDTGTTKAPSAKPTKKASAAPKEKK